jgi:polyisoprenoid-binding protein YceI
MAIDAQSTQIPSGTWTLDPVHSVATFAVRHMMVGTFRGEFTEIDASLTDGRLIGKVKVDSLKIKDERLRAHLLSPDFFDAERYPEIVYESSSLSLDGDKLTSDGALTVKGQASPVTATGRFAGPAVTLGEVEKIGIDLDATVNREAVGLTWNAPLPKGGFVLGDEVTLSVSLEMASADEED